MSRWKAPMWFPDGNGGYHCTSCRISVIHRGRVFSDSHKISLSEAKKGEKNPMYKKKLSPQHRAALVQCGRIPWNKGLKNCFSEEVLDKMRKGRLANPPKKYHHTMEFRNSRRGENNPSWNGGTSKLHDSIRKSPEYAQWRDAVFERDDYTCLVCGKSSSGNIEAHHNTKSLSELISSNNIHTVLEALDCSELWDVGNGITICRVPCHKKTFSYARHHA